MKDHTNLHHEPTFLQQVLVMCSVKFTQIVIFNKKYCIQKTLNPSTDADSSINTKRNQNKQQMQEHKKIFIYIMSHIMCHVSRVMCHVLPVTCNLLHVTNTNSHSHRPAPLSTVGWFELSLSTVGWLQKKPMQIVRPIQF